MTQAQNAGAGRMDDGTRGEGPSGEGVSGAGDAQPRDVLKERIDAAIRLSDGTMPIAVQVESEEERQRGLAMLKGRHHAAMVEVRTRDDLEAEAAATKRRIDEQYGIGPEEA